MNHYEKAIDILESNLDWRAICVEIGKRNPSVLCMAAASLSWASQVKGMTKIEAIKTCRNLTGASLKDAKEAVEQLPEFKQ